MKPKQCEELGFANGVLDMVVERIIDEITLTKEQEQVCDYVKKALINQRNTLINLSNALNYYLQRAQSTKKMIAKYKKLSADKSINVIERKEAKKLLNHFIKSVKTDYSDLVFSYIQQSRLFLSELDVITDNQVSKKLIAMDGNFTLFITAKTLSLSSSSCSLSGVILSLKVASAKLLRVAKNAEACYKRNFKVAMSQMKLTTPYEPKERIELDNRLLLNQESLVYTFLLTSDPKAFLNSRI